LRKGVKTASEKRVQDLLTEYVELKPYLEALHGAPAVATEKRLTDAMGPKIRRSQAQFTLHLGAGGWHKVLDRLVMVGVMGKKSGEPGEKEKLSVALLYRDGLGVKSAGLR
jgi:hypothetical protein